MKIVLITFLTLFSLNTYSQNQELKKVNLDSLEDISSQSIKATKGVTSVLFNGNGEKLCVSSLDHSLTTFDLNMPHELWSHSGENHAPIASAGMPGTDFFISAQDPAVGGHVYLVSWDVGHESSTLTSYTGGPTGIAYHNGKVAWAGKNEKLFEFDINSQQYTTHAKWMIHRGNVTTVAYTPEGTILTGGDDGVIYKWVGPEPEEVTYFDDRVGCVASGYVIKNATAEENSPKVAAADLSGRLKVMNLGERSVLYEDSLWAPVNFIRFHPTDPSLLVVATPKALYFINWQAKETSKVITFNNTITALDISVDGQKIALGFSNGSVGLYTF